MLLSQNQPTDHHNRCLQLVNSAFAQFFIDNADRIRTVVCLICGFIATQHVKRKQEDVAALFLSFAALVSGVCIDITINKEFSFSTLSNAFSYYGSFWGVRYFVQSFKNAAKRSFIYQNFLVWAFLPSYIYLYSYFPDPVGYIKSCFLILAILQYTPKILFYFVEMAVFKYRDTRRYYYNQSPPGVEPLQSELFGSGFAQILIIRKNVQTIIILIATVGVCAAAVFLNYQNNKVVLQELMHQHIIALKNCGLEYEKLDLEKAKLDLENRKFEFAKQRAAAEDQMNSRSLIDRLTGNKGKPPASSSLVEQDLEFEPTLESLLLVVLTYFISPTVKLIYLALCKAKKTK